MEDSEPAPTDLDDSSRRLPALFLKQVEDDDCLLRYVVDDPPVSAVINDSQLMAAGSDAGHCPGVRHPELLTPLESPEKQPSRDPR